MLTILIMLAAAYATVIALMYGLQRILLYHPSRRIEEVASYALTGFEDHSALTADNKRIHLWYFPAKPGFPTILYFHGNAFHMGGRAPIYRALAAKGFGMLAVSYRGYGKSEGSPTEQGLYIDARTAMGFLKDKGIGPQQIMLYGESLGTGVATQMATEFPVGALILQSPYTAVEDRAAELYRFIPVRRLIKDKFRSIDKIGQVKSPLLLFHGELDDTIPVAHGRAMLQAANEPKQGYFLSDTNHNDFDSALLSEHVLTFARKYGLIGELVK